MAMQLAIARQNEIMSCYIICCLQPHLRFVLFSGRLSSSLTPGSAVETPQAAGLGPRSDQALRQRSSPFFPEVHYELTKSWRAPYSSHIRPSASVALTFVDGAEEKRYEHLPPFDESVAAHICPPTAIQWKVRASHPSKLCRTRSALAGHAYSAAGQAASALHSMAVLQVFQAKMLTNIINTITNLDSTVSSTSASFIAPKEKLHRFTTIGQDELNKLHSLHPTASKPTTCLLDHVPTKLLK